MFLITNRLNSNSIGFPPFAKKSSGDPCLKLDDITKLLISNAPEENLYNLLIMSMSYLWKYSNNIKKEYSRNEWLLSQLPGADTRVADPDSNLLTYL